MAHLDAIRERLQREAGVLVQVAETRGSVPRERGAWMVVWAGALTSTIGGGHLEHDAMQHARAMLAEAEPAPMLRRYALGPSLGQCCGGVVQLAFRPIAARDFEALRIELAASLAPVAVFGGGHVGLALTTLLAGLPFSVRWIDSREDVFPDGLPVQIATDQCEPVQDAVMDLAPGSRVLIMSFSHAEDFDILQACLRRQRLHGDLPFIGLIGSKTKWATFSRRLRERGFLQRELDRVTCPIGLPGIAGKEPEVIAVAVAAQLLQQLQGSARDASPSPAPDRRGSARETTASAAPA